MIINPIGQVGNIASGAPDIETPNGTSIGGLFALMMNSQTKTKDGTQMRVDEILPMDLLDEELLESPIDSVVPVTLFQDSISQLTPFVEPGSPSLQATNQDSLTAQQYPNLESPDAQTSQPIETNVNTSPSQNEPFKTDLEMENKIKLEPPSNPAQQVQKSIQAEVSINETRENRSIVVELHPRELGRVTISVEQNSDQLVAKIAATEWVTIDLLNKDKNLLASALQEVGVEPENVEIHHDDRPHEQFANNTGGQRSSHQMQRFEVSANVEQPQQQISDDKQTKNNTSLNLIV